MIEDIEIKVAKARLSRMMEPKRIEKAIHKNVLAYLKSAGAITLSGSLATMLEELQDEYDDPAQANMMAYQALIEVVSKILAQNTRDLVTLVSTRAAKK